MDTLRMKLQQCVLCDINTGNDKKEGDHYNHVIHESENFIAVPTRAPIVQGWLLIVSKFHLLSYSGLDEKMSIELENFTNEIAARIFRVYGSAYIAEHGPVQAMTPTGCGVDHAHLHVLPLPASPRNLIDYMLSGFEKSWKQCGETPPLSTPNSDSIDYFYLRKFKQPGEYLRCSNMPSQLLRRVVAKMNGADMEFDWRDEQHRSNLSETIRNLSFS